jgi:pyrroline-5-carboxylate reductase
MTSPPQPAGVAGPIAMVGGGQMALAMASGFCRVGVTIPASIRFHDPSPPAVERLLAAVPGATAAASNAEAVASAPLVFLAIKPQHAEEVCREIAPALAPQAVVVSILAGVRIERLRAWLGTPRIVRVMPNTPCLVGRGVMLLCGDPAVPPERMAEVESLLETVGRVHRLPESLFDAGTGLSGSGPGFLAVVVEALADGGVRAGLPRALAMQLAIEVLAGTGALLEATGEHPATLKDRVASPGGTTIAGLAVIEAHKVRSALIEAVAAAAARAGELGD